MGNSTNGDLYTYIHTYITHEYEKYKLLRAYVQNLSHPISNDIKAPYRKMSDIITHNGIITLDCSKMVKPIGLRKKPENDMVPMQHVPSSFSIYGFLE